MQNKIRRHTSLLADSFNALIIPIVMGFFYNQFALSYLLRLKHPSSFKLLTVPMVTSVVVIYAACFGVSFCTVFTFCMSRLYLVRFKWLKWPPFGKELLIWLTVCHIFQFGFEGGTVVLIAPVPGHYLHFTFQ